MLGSRPKMELQEIRRRMRKDKEKTRGRDTMNEIKRIPLKSIPEMWEAERSGDKNWTMRFITDEQKFEILRKTPLKELELELINTETGEKFIRHPRHRCEYLGYLLLTWDQGEGMTHLKAKELLENPEDYVDSMLQEANSRDERFQKYTRKQLAEIKKEIHRIASK